ncbi:MAG TPA: type II toxin-antitoxin system VapC family toxin [Solirubrobacteraceae bacterium]|nr:type II toxin-antitoxin system VapC family toxin [Solirubrobacteraceae bacterium]
MIAVDTNVLLYATDTGSAVSDPAHAAVRRLVETGGVWGIPWPVAGEFVAQLTGPRVRLPPEQALGPLDWWLTEGGAHLLGETPQTYERFRALVVAGGARGVRVHDARIAAICLANGVAEFWTADRDYLRFPDLRVRNPLVG